MKRIGISLVLTLVLSVIITSVVSAAIALPDYKKSEILDRATCDNGATSFVSYGAQTYGINVITTPGHIFYFLWDMTGKHFLYKAAGSPEVTELSHEMWDTKLKESAINLYNNIHEISPGDCKPAE